LKAKEGNIAKRIQKTKKTRKGFEKKLLLIISKDNFQGKGKITQAIQKGNRMKRNEKGSRKSPGGNSQGPRTIFEAKGRKMKMPKGGKTGMNKQ